MELKLPPPVYGLLFALQMWLLKMYLPLITWDNETITMIGFSLMALGVVIDLWSLSVFFRSKTTVNPLKPEKASELVISGIYQVTRNPMYLGMLLILMGWACYLGSLSSLALLPVFVWVLTQVQILPEERALEKLFKESYLSYKARVRRWV